MRFLDPEDSYPKDLFIAKFKTTYAPQPYKYLSNTPGSLEDTSLSIYPVINNANKGLELCLLTFCFQDVKAVSPYSQFKA